YLLFVGGVDCPVLPEYMRMMDALRFLTRDFNDDPATACRPFDRRRSGMVLAEGCGFLVIERESTAVQRNAEIYGEILGIGQSQCVTSGPEGRSASMASAMLTAMEDAELSPEDIQHIQAHGDSSPEGDLAEAQAIMQVFGSQTASVPVSSVKSMTGHTMGASGAISMIAELLAMRNNFMVPTINMDERDPKIALDVVANQVRQQPYDTAMVNSFGRDGGNISVIIRKV
ncbi:MAG: beta-ketoacyl-[acyl-carrier-protein] synthase family protein, partial [Candidatus Sumerlaeota bacterium]